jgi:hypothetical protein
MPKRTPTSHRQAIGALIENIGGAISTYGSHIFGLDPVAPELETPESETLTELEAAPETQVERDPDKPYQPLIGDAQPDRIPTVEPERAPRKPMVRMSRAEWRKAFIELPQPFTINQAKAHTGASDNTIIRKMELFPEVVKVSESMKTGNGFGRTPATYKFDSSINPAEPEAEPEPEPAAAPPLSDAQDAAEAEGIHPLRVGKDKPKVGNKDVQALIDAAWDAGWYVLRTEGGHIKFMSTDRVSTVYTGSSPSDYRAVKNAQAELERNGLRFDHPRERTRLLGLRR